MRKTKKEYEEYLNDFPVDYESDLWIIGGKRREAYAVRKKFGTATRKYDPIGFQCGFNDWKN